MLLLLLISFLHVSYSFLPYFGFRCNPSWLLLVQKREQCFVSSAHSVMEHFQHSWKNSLGFIEKMVFLLVGAKSVFYLAKKHMERQSL